MDNSWGSPSSTAEPSPSTKNHTTRSYTQDKAYEFSLSALKAATNNFSPENKIGAGSFGVVYKGKLWDGQEVAIKRSESRRKRKKFQVKESAFDLELAFLSRLHHKHLVRLVGFCDEKDEMLLVYDFMKNGALYDHLHDKNNVEKNSSFVNSWKVRIKIALDAARGIEYLHNYAVPPIIHGDIKSSNILLDENWIARVSDFGLSLMSPESDIDYRPMKAAGTVGYIDPQYYRLNVLTDKSDVYGLGVVLLELLTGKRAIFKNGDNGGTPVNVVDFAGPVIISGELSKVLDSKVGPLELNESEAVELVAYTAMDCVSLEGKDRPIMTDIVAKLERALVLCEDSHGSISSRVWEAARLGKSPDENGQILPAANLKIYSFADLKRATRNFRPDSVLVEGGFGNVFKGWIDEKTLAPSKYGTGMAVAIKKLNSESMLGFQEWKSEVNFLGRLSHPNLVKLLGYCCEEKELLLVYEFMQKGSLENHLFKRSSVIEPISWDIRLKIALGAARGLAFLHTPEIQVIYRDFKPSNILLDGDYNAKISDFSLAKLGPLGGESHVTTHVMGTYGYAAPEYIAKGHLYVKSDVYGFGVVLLEMLTGLRAIDTTRPAGQHNLIDWAKPILPHKRKLKTILDVRMEGQYSNEAAFQAVQLTLKCLGVEPKTRPSMKEVVEALERIVAMKEKPKASKINSNHNTSHQHSQQPAPRHSWLNLNPSTNNITTGSSTTSTQATSNSTGGTRRFWETVSEGESPDANGQILPTANLKVYSFADLKNATRNFRSDTVLEEGGFWKVFKGWVDEKTLAPSKYGSGMVVAIKKLNSESMLGFQEWQTEVNFLGRLSHPNLVKLLGYCWKEKELLLVYEFIENGSLEYYLFRRSSTIELISWDIRLKIALGAARGLAFLHSSEKQAIYRDFNASNILLDENYNTKISDFGLVKLGPLGGGSHVTAYGYAAPEYVEKGHLHVKSDVYGFGVVLLEILTGLRAVDTTRPSGQHNLIDWANCILPHQRKLKSIMDVVMEGQYSNDAAFQAAQLTLRCLEMEPKNRPSMTEVVEALERIEAMQGKPKQSQINSKHNTSHQHIQQPTPYRSPFRLEAPSSGH